MKVLDWLRVNLADFTAVHFGPRDSSYRKRDGRAKEKKDTPRTRFVEVSKYALLSGGGRGWRAAGPGPQTIRLLFDKALKLQRIHLDFKEADVARMQEFVLRWSPDNGKSYREIVRQQWNFSPPGTVREMEEYAVEISDVTVLELSIVPDKSGGEARASLLNLRLA